MQEKILKGVVCSLLAQTGPPANARQRFTPSVRKNVLLPDIFEPVIITTWPNPLSVKSLVIRFSSAMRGWPSAQPEKDAFCPFDASLSWMISGKTYAGLR